MRRTKIVCTIGPATAGEAQLRALVEAGANVARLNFSHGDYDSHAKTIERLRRIGGEFHRPVALLQDLCGPKIRLGQLPPEGIEIQTGQEVSFVLQEEGDGIDNIPLPAPVVFAMLRTGEPMSINDGRVKLNVIERDADRIRAVATIGGQISTRKGVNLPDTYLPVTSVTEKDLEDLRFGIQQGVDWVAISFVRNALDLEPVRRTIESSKKKIRIIAKIEKREAVEGLDEILQVADGIMVARGDLGVEMPFDRVPIVQKEIVRKCNHIGKPVIVATQMLESMIEAPDPTRAEATDVANSILDGTDAVMLSGETAVGKHPIAAVETLDKIAIQTETILEAKSFKLLRSEGEEISVTEAVAESVCRMSSLVGAKAILCNTSSGGTARLVSKYRPKTPIIAFTPEEETYKQLALTWGVQPFLIEKVKTADEMLFVVVQAARSMEIAEPGDKVVITSGLPVGMSGSTSLVKVHTIGTPIGT